MKSAMILMLRIEWHGPLDDDATVHGIIWLCP